MQRIMITTRDNQAEETRNKIIQAASDEIYRNGFQATTISEIIELADVSKGCFYHHFPTKQVLGYTVLEECFLKNALERWQPALDQEDALSAIIKMFSAMVASVDAEQIKLGCPINNLAQEMSPVDEGFRKRIQTIYQTWQQEMTTSLMKCQKQGFMTKNACAEDVAMLIIAAFQGATGVAKNSQEPKVFANYTRGLIQYLKTLVIKS